ncbi:RNA binding motif protein 26, partial [Caligus rogercresseyi]
QEILQANAEAKRLQEVKAKEAAQRLSELARSKQSLLEKLIAQQKVLILKFEKSEDSAEKSEILKLSKSLSAQIDSTREDVKATITAK